MTTGTARTRTDDRALDGYLHPSEAAYCAGCGCLPCREARYRYAKHYRARVAASGPALVDATATRTHLRTLLEAGYSPTVIAAVTHVDRTTIVNIDEGRHATTSRAAARRIIATTPTDLLTRAPADTYVPAIGAARRIRALQTLGWTLTHIADAAGITAARLDWTARHPDGTLPAGAHRTVRDVYDELSMRLGPSSRTAAYAKRAGWMPPLAWDDDEIDCWAAAPRSPADPGNQTDERDQVIAHLTRIGKSARFIAETVGCSDRTVVRVRQRERIAA